MRRLLLFPFIYFLFFSWDAGAQLSLEGDIWPRAEFRHGYRRMPLPDEDAAGHISQRTRLILGFSKDQITTRVSLQDVRIWGEIPALNHVPSIDLHEAWLQIAFNDRLLLRAGRQEIRYDNQRFFAINDWNHSGQKHDALVVHHLTANGELHLGAAFNQSSDRLFGTPYRLSNYKTLNYLWYKTALYPNLDLSLLAVADGFEHPENSSLLYMRGTGSAYFDFSTRQFSARANPAWQLGKTPRGQDIAAWYLMVEGSIQVTDQIQSSLGMEMYSGNDFEDPDDTYRAFEALYGAGHTAHGYMDYFLNIPAHTRGAGLVNPYLKTSFTISESTTFDTDLHMFFLQNNYVHEGSVIDRYLGTEVDFTLSYRFNPFTSIIMGYSVMFGSESMEIIKGGSKDEFAHWAYVMLRVRPKFF